jgi:hypothetical protein
MQGSVSLRAQGQPHIEVKSAVSCSTGATYNKLSLYLAANSLSAPAAPVKASIKLDSPSRGLSGVLFGEKLFTVPANGFFARVEFPVPVNVATSLGVAYSDLRITVVLDTLGTTARDYLLDNIAWSIAPSPLVVGTGPRQSLDLTLNYPNTTELADLAVLGQESVLVLNNARVTRAAGGYGTVASAGTLRTDIGIEARVGSVVSAPSVKLFDRSVVTGDVQTGGTITKGSLVTVTGQSLSGQALTPFKTLSWHVEYDLGTTAVDLGVNQTRTIVPGSYGAATIMSGAKLTLSTGTYYFTSFDLEPGGQIILNNAAGPVVVYVRGTVILRGSWQVSGRAGDLVLIATGTAPFAVETPFDGTLVAPRAGVRMAVGGTGHAGAVFAKTVQLDPNVVLTSRPPFPLIAAVGAIPGSGGEQGKNKCVEMITLSGAATSGTSVGLQELLLRYCARVDTGPCETTLLAQISVDYYLAALQFAKGTMAIGKHYSLMLDRERKTAQIHGNETLACQILGGDVDKDLVPSPRDGCPNTPLLTATLDSGCTDATVYPTPPAGEVLANLPKVGIVTDPRCLGAPSPIGATALGAYRKPTNPAVGKALWVSRDLGDTTECPKWYMLQGELTDGSVRTIAFLPEADVTLPWIQRADDVLQFNVRTTDGGNRGAWASYDVFTRKYRVLVVNAAGRHSGWSDWFRPGQDGCAAGACDF